MILLAFRHGLRSAELVSLRWDQIDFSAAVLHVSRSKGGVATTHPLGASEMRALRRLKREQQPASPFVFVSERGAPFSTRGYRALVSRLADAAGFEFPISTHMLRLVSGPDRRRPADNQKHAKRTGTADKRDTYLSARLEKVYRTRSRRVIPSMEFVKCYPPNHMPTWVTLTNSRRWHELRTGLGAASLL